MIASLFWFWLGGVAGVSSIGLVTSPRSALNWRAWLAWLAWPAVHVYLAALSRRRLFGLMSRALDDVERDEDGQP